MLNRNYGRGSLSSSRASITPGGAIFGRGFKGLDPMMPTVGSLACGLALLVPVSLVVDQPWTLAPSAESILALLGLSVFSTALAFVIYVRLVLTLGSVGTIAKPI